MTQEDRELFVKKLESALLNKEWSDAAFAEVICQASQGLTDDEMCSMFAISIPTVNRWKVGMGRPHRLMRPGIYRLLLEHYKTCT